MIFHDKYELLALRGGDREIALPGKELSSGRAVLVHLLTTGYTPENREVLVTIEQLPAEYRLRVLDIGDHEGIPYVVTEVLPSNLNLREWLAAAKAAPKQPANLGRSGVWRIPADSGAPTRSNSPASEAGEFTRLFQTIKEPEQVRPAPPTPQDLPTAAMQMPKLGQPDCSQITPVQRAEAAQANEAPAARRTSPVAEPEPGEFTRMLHASEAPSPAATAATPAPTAQQPEPGEFTRLLRASEAPSPAAAPAAAPAPTAQQPEPGEFTSLLRAVEAPSPAAPAATPAATEPQPEPPVFTPVPVSPAAPPAPMPTAAIPQPAAPSVQAAPELPHSGEFTRMLQAQTPVTPPPAKISSLPPPLPRTSAPGEFTRMMQSPLAPEPLHSQPAASPAQPASEFTRMMQAGQFNEAPPRVTPMPPAAPAPHSAGHSLQTPGEFTRMFATNPAASESLAMPAAPQEPLPQGGLATGAFSRRAAPPPPQPGLGPSEFTQMFAARPQAPAATAPAPKPTPPAPKTQKSPLALILVLAGLLLLVVIVIVVFALTR